MAEAEMASAVESKGESANQWSVSDARGYYTSYYEVTKRVIAASKASVPDELPSGKLRPFDTDVTESHHSDSYRSARSQHGAEYLRIGPEDATRQDPNGKIVFGASQGEC